MSRKFELTKPRRIPLRRKDMKHILTESANILYNKGIQEGRQSKLKEELEFLKNLNLYDITENYPNMLTERIEQIEKELAGVNQR